MNVCASKFHTWRLFCHYLFHISPFVCDLGKAGFRYYSISWNLFYYLQNVLDDSVENKNQVQSGLKFFGHNEMFYHYENMTI